ncbi:copper-binding protein [Rhodosalinus halophilus]|uniref:Copper-binding protein n=1 Tax=Rhodosalinus halophilus TaxID=2259333 RepID=A0A365U6M6_9RHOB|nr:copper chaperone PCu(A)C [Rhodosalinus halophilus]RBI84257.1 copper-binding protein [Rhodosalinus halophilus]
MPLKTLLLAGAMTLAALPAAAMDGITVKDAYARSSGAMAASGAAFMVIENHSGQDDRLIGAASDVAERTELHTHREDDMGVMRMIHVEEGFALPAGETLMLARGGRHVMFLGLAEPFEQGDVVTLTLEFEEAGPIEVEVPVDLERQPMNGQGMGHGHGQSMN